MVGPAGSPLSPGLMMLVPVVGGLLVGLMAHFGSDKIRGHGIPEAIEAILLNGARVDPKVAVLKPVSAAIAIGSGGPFGAEGPIIMTGGAFGSMVAQWLKLTDAERTTLLVAGAAAGHVGNLCRTHCRNIAGGGTASRFEEVAAGDQLVPSCGLASVTGRSAACVVAWCRPDLSCHVPLRDFSWTVSSCGSPFRHTHRPRLCRAQPIDVWI